MEFDNRDVQVDRYGWSSRLRLERGGRVPFGLARQCSGSTVIVVFVIGGNFLSNVGGGLERFYFGALDDVTEVGYRVC